MSWQNLQTAEFLEAGVHAICYINFYTSDRLLVVVNDVELTVIEEYYSHSWSLSESYSFICIIFVTIRQMDILLGPLCCCSIFSLFQM
jgi:hypothetical protein